MTEKKPVVSLSWQPQLPIPSMSKATYLPSHTKPQINAPTSTLWKPNSELVNGLFVPPNDPRKVNKLLRQQVKDTLGKDWFDMPAQTIAPELQRDLKLQKLRGVMDPKTHYKRSDSNSKNLPKYIQIGTIVDSPLDYHTGRLTKRERGKHPLQRSFFLIKKVQLTGSGRFEKLKRRGNQVEMQSGRSKL